MILAFHHLVNSVVKHYLKYMSIFWREKKFFFFLKKLNVDAWKCRQTICYVVYFNSELFWNEKFYILWNKSFFSFFFFFFKFLDAQKLKVVAFCHCTHICLTSETKIVSESMSICSKYARFKNSCGIVTCINMKMCVVFNNQLL